MYLFWHKIYGEEKLHQSLLRCLMHCRFCGKKVEEKFLRIHAELNHFVEFHQIQDWIREERKAVLAQKRRDTWDI